MHEHEPTNTSRPGTRGTHKVEDTVAVKGTQSKRLPLESSGLFREDRTIELAFRSSVPGASGGLVVTVTETGERGQDVVWSFQLPDKGAHRFAVAAGLRIDVVAEIDGVVNFRTLNAGPKRAPPVNSPGVVLPALGAWVDIGACPPFRTDVCVFRGDKADVEAAFFTFAGVFVAWCPPDNIVIHPPMCVLRGRNNSAAAPNTIIAVWR